MRARQFMRRMLAVCAGFVLCTAARQAMGTVISGSYNNQTGDGYLTGPDSYVVVSPAQFNQNTVDGLYVGPVTTAVTIDGGQFNGNGVDGVDDLAGTLAIDDGQFSGNSVGVQIENPTTTINGGTFAGNFNTDIAVIAGATKIFGGQYSLMGTNFFAEGGSLDLYGEFNGVAPGTTQTINAFSGTFTGTLANNSVSETYTYTRGAGTITLHSTATPEPTMIGLLSVAAIGLVQRRRRIVLRSVLADRGNGGQAQQSE